MDQELLMKQIVEQVMAAMKNGTPASAPAAASSCGSKVTAANYPPVSYTHLTLPTN